MLGFLWAFYWLLYELLGLVSQDFSADWMARKRESQPVLGKAHNKKAFKSIAPSLPCYIGKLVHNLEKIAGLQALGSSAGSAQQRIRRRVMWKREQQLERGKE